MLLFIVITLAQSQYKRGNMRYKGFTLAEVLITIGVIGVVAAMTIPLLLSSYRKHVIETQLKEFYSMFNQAIKLSEAENEDIESWDWPVYGTLGGTTEYEWYVKYLQPYLKSGTVKKSYHIYNSWMNGFAVEFINGNGISCGTNSTGIKETFFCLYFIDSKKLAKIHDNAAENYKVVPGRDYFLFTINKDNPQNKGLQPANSDACFQTTGVSAFPSGGCAQLIKNNG